MCERCRNLGSLSDTFVVRSPAGTASLNGSALLERLKSGRLSGQDWIFTEDGPPLLVAAHPAFSGAFASGEIGDPPIIEADAPAAPAGAVRPPRRRLNLPWGRMASAVLAAGGLAAAAFLAFQNQDQLRALATGASEVVQPSAPGEAATAPRPDPSLPPADPLAALAKKEGPVEEPLALLHAQAVAALTQGTAADSARALALARRAVARSTRDPDALALYALLASEAGEGAAVIAAEQAIALGLGGPATQLGRGALARTNGDFRAAAAAVATCAGQGDFLCRLLAANALAADSAAPAEGIAALDALAVSWPAHQGLLRTAARVAAAGDRLDARARLEALQTDDPAVAGALAALAFRDGDLDAGLATAIALGDAAPPDVRLSAARVLLAKGDAAGILAMVGEVGGKGTTGAVAAEARLLVAQARWMLARDHADQLPAAKAAVASVLELGRSDPAVAQVRALVANAEDLPTEIARAWSSMDVSRRSGPELARVLKTQVALMEARRAPVSDLLPVAEAARAADPSDAYTHVWVVHVHLVGHEYGKAIEALRLAIHQVDGQSARRRADIGTLETGAPAKGLRKELDEHLGNEALYASTLPLARGVSEWLAGDLAAAKAAIAAAPHLEDDADALALRARVRGASKDAIGAMNDWQKVVLLRPKDSEYLLGALAATVAAGHAKEAGPIAELVRSSRVYSALGPAMLAEVWLVHGDSAAALAQLEAAVAQDPLDMRSRARLRALRQTATPPAP